MTFSQNATSRIDWWNHEGGEQVVGYGETGFCFDNETPCHRVLVQPFSLANRTVTNGEFLAFVEDKGYQRPELWLADGWQTVSEQRWSHPLYWRMEDGAWSEYRLSGLQPLELEAPVCHLSGYEAEAYARWADARLPTEFEWEAIASRHRVAGHFVDSGVLHPRPANHAPAGQLFGDTWEWTASSYAPYPGYRPAAGAIGEYNGKFMCNQWVLRGGSCVSSADHVRASYRNFFYPADRWQFSGLRLARDLDESRS